MAARIFLLLLAPALASALAAVPAVPQLRGRGDPESKYECHGSSVTTDSREFMSQCPACRLHGIDAPRLYIKEPKDGLGSRLHEVIAGMAIAAHTGTALAGVSHGKVTCLESHGIDIIKAAGVFFGMKSPGSMFAKIPEKMDQVWPGLASYLDGIRKFGRPRGNQSVFIVNHCLSCEIDKERGSMSLYYTPRFLDELRRASFIWREPLAHKTGSKLIAIHVRRGDVDSNDKDRGTSDMWYFTLIEQLRTLVPDADIHVFSSLERRGRSSEFDGYRTRGVTVHLDGDPMEAWAHFAAADVLVMAKSSFSHVPAFLNENCVVYQPYWHRPLDEWVSAQADDVAPLSVAATRALKDCIERKTGNNWSSASKMVVSVGGPKNRS
jgi:hypothetical protein